MFRLLDLWGKFKDFWVRLVNPIHLKGDYMSNQEPITVTNSGAGGFDVEIRFNHYRFDVLTSRDALRFLSRNKVETEELLHVLEGVLDQLKTEVIIDKAETRINPHHTRPVHKSLDDP